MVVSGCLTTCSEASVVRLAVRIVTIICVVYAVGSLFIQGLQSWPRSNGAWTLQAYPSPDGAMKAVATIYDGGHLLAPYCFSGVSILPRSTSDEEAKAPFAQVFSGICGAFIGDNGASMPKISWLDDKHLKIEFPIYFHEGQSKAEYVLANLDNSKQISVSYSAHQ